MYVKDPGRLRRRRLTMGLTQRQLAALVGSTQQYVSLLESGNDRDCSERITLKLCRWLEVDPEDYFEERVPSAHSAVSPRGPVSPTRPVSLTGPVSPRRVSATAPRAPGASLQVRPGPEPS